MGIPRFKSWVKSVGGHNTTSPHDFSRGYMGGQSNIHETLRRISTL